MALGLVGNDYPVRAKEWREIERQNKARAASARKEGQHKIANDCQQAAKAASEYAERYENAS